MRVRKQDTITGDMQFGHSGADVWFNQVDGVGQVVKTRLLLYAGEWFLDTAEGTPWGGFPLNDFVVRQGKILGADTQLTRDVAIKTRVLGSLGVTGISNYSSSVDVNRRFTVSMTIDTIYGSFALNLP
jgi:hypothetical protein